MFEPRSARKLPCAVERQLGRDREVARLVVAQEGFLPLAGPFDRPADPPRRPGDEREFRVEGAARAEIAADLVHDDADFVLGHVEDRRQFLLWPHRAADPGIKRVAPGVAVIGAGGGARLHRHPDDALHPGIEAGDMGRAGKGGVGRGAVADFGVEADIRGGIPAHPRRACRDRRRRVRYRRQRLVIDGDLLGRVLGRGEGDGHRHRDDLADVDGLVGGHRKMRGNEGRRAVAVDQRDVGRMPGAERMRDRPQPVGQEIAAGQHRQHARHCARRRGIERADAGMRVRRAHHRRIGEVREGEIVAVAALADQQPAILPAPHRLPDPRAARPRPHRSVTRARAPLPSC